MELSLKQLLECGAHFGHQVHRWNPKIEQYLFGIRNNIHIIDLTQTVPAFYRALDAITETVAKGGRILLVGTKRQASPLIAEAARRSAQYYVNSRWLGGTLTNWKTVSASIHRLRKIEEMLEEGAVGLTKKERLMLDRQRAKLEKDLGGIKDMGGIPDLLFVVDTNKEQLALKEAKRLNIPVAAIVDTNSDPDGITYVIPANDDASRAIELYCDLVAQAALEGISQSQANMGVDIGSLETPPIEQIAGSEVSDQAMPEPERVEQPTQDAQSEPSDDPSKEEFELLSAPRGAPDDLSKLQGVGPQIIQKLNDYGVYHYWQLAAMSEENVKELESALKLNGRVKRDNWIAQANKLITQSSEEL